MRLILILACGALAACTTGDVTVPSDPVLRQVQPVGAPAAAPATSASSAGGDFTTTISSALDEGDPGAVPLNQGVAPLNQAGTPLNDDTLNLTLYTIEQQKIDARLAEQQLAEARSQLVVIQPTAVPHGASGVNIALYAQQTNNAVGERIYKRNRGGGGGCGRYSTSDEAQRAFLAAGGPGADPRGLDPDGDGFACAWDPTPYRQLRS
jgi:hypothetical protein